MLKQIKFDEAVGKTVARVMGNRWTGRYVVFDDDTFMVMQSRHGDDDCETYEPQIRLQPGDFTYEGLVIGHYDTCIALGIYTEAEYMAGQKAYRVRCRQDEETRERHALRQLQEKYSA